MAGRMGTFRILIPVERRSDMIEEYHKLLTSDDHEAKLEAAKRWAMWEGALRCSYPSPMGSAIKTVIASYCELGVSTLSDQMVRS